MHIHVDKMVWKQKTNQLREIYLPIRIHSLMPEEEQLWGGSEKRNSRGPKEDMVAGNIHALADRHTLKHSDVVKCDFFGSHCKCIK